MVVWKDGDWQNALKTCAVPLTSLQSRILRVLAGQRSPDSYIAGDIAINRDGPRFSRDIDIFQDSIERLQSAADADAEIAAVGRLRGDLAHHPDRQA